MALVGGALVSPQGQDWGRPKVDTVDTATCRATVVVLKAPGVLEALTLLNPEVVIHFMG